MTAVDRSLSSPPIYGLYGDVQQPAFTPCPAVTPNPFGSNRALSAVRPRAPSVANSPAATMTPPCSRSPSSPARRTSPEPLLAQSTLGSIDFTLDPRPRFPEGPAVFARPSSPPRKLVLSVYGKPLNVMEMFPSLFTTFCFAVFGTPIVLCHHVGRDPQVLFWIGDYIDWVLFLPLLFVWAHIYHVIFRVPSKFVMVICLIGSCVVILYACQHVMLDAYDNANAFTAIDCDTFPQKMELQRSWEAAHTFYDNCMTEMADEMDITYESAATMYRIEDCADYVTQLGRNPDWGYLAELEEQHLCSGWCERGEAIWTLSETRDSCSSTVGDIMHSQIRFTMLQVLVYTFVVLFVISVMLVTLGPTLWRYTDRMVAYA